MKKIITAFLAIVFLFSTTGGIVADAKGGRSSSGGFSSSKSYSSSKSSGSVTKTTTKTTYHKDGTKTVSVEKLKYKSTYTQPNYQPAGYNYSSYQGKPYYNESSGFATTVMTSALTGVATYMILDHFDDNGAPVYIDSETGEVVQNIDELDAQPVDLESNDADNTDWSFVGILLALVCAGAIVFMLFRR